MVYLEAARRLLGGESLYGQRSALPFTYPPLAAVAFVPLAWLPNWVAATGWLLLNLCVSWWLLRRIFGPAPLTVVALAAFTAPFARSLYLGQLNIVLFALVWLAVSADPRSRWSGWSIGLAASLKLTPAWLAMRYAVQGRWRQVLVSAGVAMAGVVLAWALTPGESLWYWTEGIRDPSHVGGADYSDNQSLVGFAAKVLPAAPSPWVLAAVIVTALASAYAARRWRAHRVEAFVAVGLGGLLLAPVSWSHHFLWLTVMVAVLRAHGHPRLAGALLGALLIEPLVVDGLVGWTPEPLRGVAASHYTALAVASLVYLCRQSPRSAPHAPLPTDETVTPVG